MAGFSSYAETVSVYGTEKSFIDGDDTPWSKAFLAAAYASRGIKMRCTSGAGAELLMGFHEAKSLLYLEARCLCLQRGMGFKGPRTAASTARPDLHRAWRLPRADGGEPDCRVARPRMRQRQRRARDRIRNPCWRQDHALSGGGVRPHLLRLRIDPQIDNSFNPSLLNGEELEDYLVLQRDFEADGGLTPLPEEKALDLRRRAIDALSAVFEELGLADRQRK